MTPDYKIPRSYRLAQATIDKVATVAETTGQSSTGVLEAAINDYSVKWFIFDKFAKRPEMARIYLEMLDTTQRMLRGKPAIKEWDQPIIELLTDAARIAVMNKRGAVKEKSVATFDAMLARLQEKIGTLRQELKEQ